MPSGYVTSDGKDLDERYLGINDKAKSAETADTATTATTAETANSVVWGGITERPSSLYRVNYGAKVTGSIDKYGYVCPKDGFAVVTVSVRDNNYYESIYVNEVKVGDIDCGYSGGTSYGSLGFPVSSGDKITATLNTRSRTIEIFPPK